MSNAGYNKGFGGSGRRSTPTAGRAAPPPDPRRERGVFPHGPGRGDRPFDERGDNATLARQADPTKRPWADHAGRVGGSLAGLGFLAGLLSLAFQGNWAAPIVLPILLGLIGFITFWLAAKVLDAFRGL